METFHTILIGFHRFTSLHSFVGLQMILPLYVYIYIYIYIERERERDRERKSFVNQQKSVNL